MKAVRWYAPRDLRIEEVDEPVIATPDEVIIAVKRAGICGTDLHDYIGPPKSIPVDTPHPLTGHKAPVIMGHEFAGDVTAVGSEVDHVKVGDRVCVMPLHRCGKCYFCQRGLYHLCVMQAGTGLQWYWGAFADYCKVHSYNVIKIPDNMTYEQGALVEPAALAMYALDRANFKAGDTVFIAGGGPTAVLDLLCLKAFGAGDVYMSEIQPGRLKRLKAYGATEVFDGSKDNIEEALKDFTGGVGVDIAIDCTGAETGINDCFNVLRNRGMYVQSGLATGEIKVRPWDWALKDLNMCGLWCYNTYDFPKVIKCIANGTIPVEKVVTRTIMIDEIVDEGFEVLAFDKAGKELKIQVVVRESR
jgi:(R,R)-butanediol dehydrogenase/meso-butanediol dehydrogenase/diacetyl reductase